MALIKLVPPSKEELARRTASEKAPAKKPAAKKPKEK